MRKIPLILFVLSACSPLTEENAPERFAETTCRKIKVCDEEQYENIYDSDFEECVDEQTDAYEFILDVGGIFGLDLDLDELKGCIKDIRKASCDEFAAGDVGPDCDDVLSF